MSEHLTASDHIAKAVALLREGKPVAFPTETVYGLGADASNELAVRKVFQIKERPYDHPLIVHISRLKQINDWAKDVPEDALKLAKAFWPGPLTIVLKKQPAVLDCVTGGQDTVALRMPSHPMAQSLIESFGSGLVAPSANKFTHISPTTAAAVHEEFGDTVMVLDGGASKVGLESTIIDMTAAQPVILRPGVITAEAIVSTLGKKVLSAKNEKTTTRAPGMHHLHYAPQTKTTIIDKKNIPAFLQTVKETDLPMVFAMYSDMELLDVDQVDVDYVKLPADAAGYAHELYRTLRALDGQHYKRIMVEAVPSDIEWEAIRDRLFKATGGIRGAA